MIQIRRISTVPAHVLSALVGYSAQELAKIGPEIEQVFATSEGMWLCSRGDVPVCLVGLQYHGLFAGGRVWFMGCTGLHPIRRDFIRAARRALRLVPFGLDVYVEKGFKDGCDFVRLFHFREVGPVDRFIQFRREPWPLQQH